MWVLNSEDAYTLGGGHCYFFISRIKCGNGDLLYNGDQSYSLCFKPKCSTFHRPTDTTLNHLNIPNVNQSKYLGIVINETNCNPDLKRQMCKLYANINMIITKFSKCSAVM